MTSVAVINRGVDPGLVAVVIGVDTHVHTHTAVAVRTDTGAQIAMLSVVADPAGYGELVDFADDLLHQTGGLSEQRLWAIEGTGCHGAGLTRHLQGRGEVVVELDRPERARRRHGAKSDPLDAERAAREAMTRSQLGAPRALDGPRQAVSVLLAARRSAMDTLAVAQRQIFALVIAAPEPVRARFRGPDGLQRAGLEVMTRIASRLRHRRDDDLVTTTTIAALRALAARAHAAQAEAETHLATITAVVKDWRPDLLEEPGIGPVTAAVVLCAWSHTARVHSEAGFAMLAGTAPIPANSGTVTRRYRLNRSGDRQLNRAIHTIALTRARIDPATRAYIERRTAEGKTPREIRRCLKRYITRDLYRRLETPPQHLDPT